MSAAQARLADTLEAFYGSADRTSEGAMAGHAYKRSVDDFDAGIGRELVSQSAAGCELEALVLIAVLVQDVPFRTTILEPLGKMNAYFPVINEHIAKRAKKVCHLPYQSDSTT
jgi:bridging integrator 3